LKQSKNKLMMVAVEPKKSIEIKYIKSNN